MLPPLEVDPDSNLTTYPSWLHTSAMVYRRENIRDATVTVGSIMSPVLWAAITLLADLLLLFRYIRLQ